MATVKSREKQGSFKRRKVQEKKLVIKHENFGQGGCIFQFFSRMQARKHYLKHKLANLLKEGALMT